MMRFSIPIAVQAKERPRSGKNAVTGETLFYTPKKSKVFERQLGFYVSRKMLQMGWWKWGKKPVVPLMAILIFQRAVKDKKLWGQLCPARPDIDNLMKACLDGLNNVTFFDDGRIARTMSEKLYAQHSQLDLIIMEANHSNRLPVEEMCEAAVRHGIRMPRKAEALQIHISGGEKIKKAFLNLEREVPQLKQAITDQLHSELTKMHALGNVTRKKKRGRNSITEAEFKKIKKNLKGKVKNK